MKNLDLEYTGSGNGKRFTIASKIKVVEAVKAGVSIYSVSKQTGVSIHAIINWVGDYDLGKYTLENTTMVVRKPKTSLVVVLEQAEKAATEANAKVERIKNAIATLEAEGIRVV